MKTKFTIISFLLLIQSLMSLGQTSKSFMDIGLYTGFNKGNGMKKQGVHVNAYEGKVFGGYAAYNKNRFSFKFSFDYVPTSIRYTFYNLSNPEWKLNHKDKFQLMNYGAEFGFRVNKDVNNQVMFLLGFIFMHEKRKDSDKEINTYFNEFYDPAIQANNKRMVLNVSKKWGDDVVLVPFIGVAYQTKVVKVPLFVQLQIMHTANVFSEKRQYYKFRAFTGNVGDNELLQYSTWKSNAMLRFNVGISLFQFGKRLA